MLESGQPALSISSPHILSVCTQPVPHQTSAQDCLQRPLRWEGVIFGVDEWGGSAISLSGGKKVQGLILLHP